MRKRKEMKGMMKKRKSIKDRREGDIKKKKKK